MPAQEVLVDVNRAEPGAIEVPDEVTEANDSFTLHLRNHGDPGHVHVKLDGVLASIATLEEGNHYVPGEDEAIVPVTIDSVDETVSGTIEVSSRFGAQTASIPVVVPGEPRPVEVDDRLTEPGRGERASERDEGGVFGPLDSLSQRAKALRPGSLGPATVGLIALGLLAIAIVVTAAIVVDVQVAAVGMLVVGAGIIVAIAVLRG